ncbi:hypothetical protein CRG98_010163 [Punica granatum]|uniref:Uncharacterized protein n=1 Tax=Punica granatum TaxID=22663 RepID=A0A2I0KM97_PUNGR|nr:hypothetical protein CRG98_010163 [Punica granatum]
MARKQVNLSIKFGKIEGLIKKKEGESSKKTATVLSATGGRKGKETAINVVNSGHQRPQLYSVSFTPAPPTAPAYAPSPMHYQPQHPAQLVYYWAPSAPLPPPAP